MTKVILHLEPIEIETNDTDEQIFRNFDINRYSYLEGIWDIYLDHIERKTEVTEGSS